MTRGEKLYLRLLIEGIVDAHNLDSGQSKDRLCALIAQRLHHRFPTGDGVGVL